MLRLGIISVIGIMVCVNIIQYRYNKPSLKEPLYSMIKEYLEKDLLQENYTYINFEDGYNKMGLAKKMQ